MVACFLSSADKKSKSKATMSAIRRLNAQLFTGSVVPLLDVHTLLAVASTDRYFRWVLRQESVWKRLHERDQPYLLPGQYMPIVVGELQNVVKLLSARDISAADMRRALRSAYAVGNLLEELREDSLHRIQAQIVAPQRVWAWGFMLLLRDATSAIDAVPGLAHSQTEFVDFREARPDCIVGHLSSFTTGNGHMRHWNWKRRTAGQSVSRAAGHEVAIVINDDQPLVAKNDKNESIAAPHTAQTDAATTAAPADTLVSIISTAAEQPVAPAPAPAPAPSDAKTTIPTRQAFIDQFFSQEQHPNRTSAFAAAVAQSMSTSSVYAPFLRQQAQEPALVASDTDIDQKQMPLPPHYESKSDDVAVDANAAARVPTTTAFDLHEYGSRALSLRRHSPWLLPRPALICGPMCKSKAHYIARARRRAKATTVTTEGVEHARWSVLIDQFVRRWTIFAIAAALPTATIMCGYMLDRDQHPFEPVVYLLAAAMALSIANSFLKSVAYVIFILVHVSRYGNNTATPTDSSPSAASPAASLLPDRHQWVYGYFGCERRPSHEGLSRALSECFVASLPVIAVSTAVAIPSAAYWLLLVLTISALTLTAGFALIIGIFVFINISQRWSRPESNWRVNCIALGVYLVIAFASLCGLVAAFSYWLAAIGVTGMLDFAVDATLALSGASAIVFLFFAMRTCGQHASSSSANGADNFWVAALLVIPLVVTFGMVVANRQFGANHSWSSIFIPVDVIACLLMLSVLSGVTDVSGGDEFGPSLDWLRLRKVDSIWQRAELSAVQKRQLEAIRDSDELNTLLQLWPNLVQRANKEYDRRYPGNASAS